MMLLGIFGVFVGTLPDLFPNIAPNFLFGETRAMKVGYARIIEFTQMQSTKRESGIALKKDTSGYEAILRILHNVNPKIVPSPKERKGNAFGNISTDRSTFVFVNPGIDLTFNKEIYFQTDEKHWKEVCEIRDLHYIIEAAVGRYYTKIGFLFALIAILIEGFSSIRGVLVARY
jgi:hypothetical protein